MNREAVALGTPVYTTFQGRLGAVDERLIAEGRMRMLSDVDRLDLGRRDRASSTRAHPPRSAAADRAAARAARSPLRASAPKDPPVGLGPYNHHNAPTDPLGGPTPPPSRAAAAGSGRGAGRARVLPRLPAALRQRTAAAVRRAARQRRSGGCSAGSLPLLVLARVYQRRWRYAGQRDYEAVVRAVVAIVLLTRRRDRGAAPCAQLSAGVRGRRLHAPPQHRRGRAAQRRDRAVRAALAGVPRRRACARAQRLRATSAGCLPWRT